ncbi:DUF547 domain-containing protein [Desulfococcus sp.]|uniref:DUF547 domain-containing protein n=1 Tax=Desulfococcus sp. TaxID=2025834 RepID=UPI0035933B27
MNIAWFMAGLMLSAGTASAGDFDHGHGEWRQLLGKHVVWIDGGGGSQVDYDGFQKDRSRLTAYLESLSAVSRKTFDGWSRERRLAFLINAYNAFTVELILTRYPDLTSIKDLGSLLSSPWKKKFFNLLEEKRHLDWIEHDMIRKPGVYDDPRIHAAVNCASVGCPALRDEAFAAERLDAQLEDNLIRFLKDRSRNRYNPRSGTLEVSRIFDWYGGDFREGYRGYDTLEGFFAIYADLLGDAPADRERIRSRRVKIDFLEYDWRLNGAR